MHNEILVKVVVIGDSGVGKTSILNSFINNEFKSAMESTNGASYLCKSVETSNKTISFQIWDTAGQERFHSLASVFYKGAHAAIIVYDITKKSSFESLQKWVNELNKQGPANLIMVIVGNKIDLIEHESVSFEEGESYSKELGALFKLTSAKNKIGINELFDKITEKFLERVQNRKIKEPDEEKLQLEQGYLSPKKEKCCLK